VSPVDRAVGLVVRRLPGFDGERRAEVVATVREATTGAGPVTRAAEVASLLGLGLRLRARRSAHLLVRGAALGTAVAVLTAFAPVPIAVVVPVVLLGLGWFDPRYAAAAAVVWTWRFVVAGVGEVPATGVVLFLRLVAMATGVLAATAVTQASLRRLTLR
jgi:hypothetical protein